MLEEIHQAHLKIVWFIHEIKNKHWNGLLQDIPSQRPPPTWWLDKEWISSWCEARNFVILKQVSRVFDLPCPEQVRSSDTSDLQREEESPDVHELPHQGVYTGGWARQEEAFVWFIQEPRTRSWTNCVQYWKSIDPPLCTSK